MLEGCPACAVDSRRATPHALSSSQGRLEASILGALAALRRSARLPRPRAGKDALAQRLPSHPHYLLAPVPRLDFAIVIPCLPGVQALQALPFTIGGTSVAVGPMLHESGTSLACRLHVGPRRCVRAGAH